MTENPDESDLGCRKNGSGTTSKRKPMKKHHRVRLLKAIFIPECPLERKKRRDPIKGVSRRFYIVLKWVMIFHLLRRPCLKMNIC
ncbi:hypothetical protein DN050_12170 [Heyndrickxia coagulans]|nr:hypothetical protein CIW84_00155 [Heyndrickxia coagulans]AVD57744.1 hypothetical protein C3766_17695 [Heyndrickxia coagulans]RCS33880.1 hypothetical protein DN050_12170 [Heyndrickxia coagulans]